ncbi:MAG TPA: amidohydrolase family protein [Candidatus Binataceae bacterium]|nr:amidohydrolase family protein [Candidatus Binataceae bacterium]
MATKSKSQMIHARLGHPVIDSDGHWREFEPIALDYLKETAGAKAVERWSSRVRFLSEADFTKLTVAQRLDRRASQPAWWGMPVKNTLDVATSFLPRLMHERLEQMGLDFAILYPTHCQLFAPYIGDEELRRAGCHAFNRYAAETWADYSDRVAPIGAIPMHTPEEAIAELEHCKTIGIKAVALGSLIRRSIPEAERLGVSRRYACWLDVLGIDSVYDYDPVWRKCEELGYPVTFHSAASNFGLRNSISNFVYNHIGHFGEAGNAVAKALVIGGVTYRFPRLKFAFLEGGVAWGCSLLADLLSHWEKRNGKAILELDPSKTDRAKLAELFKQYGSTKMWEKFAEFERTMLMGGSGHAAPAELDDFAAAHIERKADLRERFVPNFFFGCESDDPTVTYAFAAANPFGAKLGAVLSSDISHFDVPDMTQVLEEAWELVEEKGLSEEDFNAFTFGNAAKLWASLNADFFKDTTVETAVRQYLESNPSGQSAAAS